MSRTVTWQENYAIIQERMNSYNNTVAQMNYNGWASKASLHAFASRLHDFSRRTIPVLLNRCRELEDALDTALNSVEKSARELEEMKRSAASSSQLRNEKHDLERQRLELELEKAKVEIQRLELEVQRLKAEQL